MCQSSYHYRDAVCRRILIFVIAMHVTFAEITSDFFILGLTLNVHTISKRTVGVIAYKDENDYQNDSNDVSLNQPGLKHRPTIAINSPKLIFNTKRLLRLARHETQ